MRIASCTFQEFPPFADATIEFPEKESGFGGAEVHFLVGANGSGKTRLLSLLAAALGNRSELSLRLGQKPPPDFKAVVAADSPAKEGQCYWFSERENIVFFLSLRRDLPQRTLLADNWDRFSIVHSHHVDWFSAAGSPMFGLVFDGLARMEDSSVEALKTISFGDPKSHLTFTRAKDESTLIAQSYTNMKMQAAMTMLHREQTNGSRWTRLCDRLENAVSEITGRKFNLYVTPYPKISLRITWGGVEMSFNQAPDGLRSILAWLTACVGKLDVAFPDHPDPLSLPGVLLIDEPEGHLHPSWQRKVLPAAQMLLPNAQIFAATHSPFIISSVNHGWIHVLRSDEKGLVRVDEAKKCGLGDTYLDVVEDILGVKEWYDPETESLLAEFRGLMKKALSGQKELVPAVEEKAKEIARRSESLSEIMRRELGRLPAA